VTATVQNTGNVTAAEVAQLYVSLPDSAPSSPPQQLRGFQKITLAPGQSGQVTFPIRKKDLAYWDVASQNWIVPDGSFGIGVGASSRDIKLKGTL
jgi:beta-glucosidase